MLFSKIYPLLEKLSKKMTCESAKCYSTAIYTTIMVVLSLQLVSFRAKLMGSKKIMFMKMTLVTRYEDGAT